MNDKIKKEWFVYMIRCMDSSLYTGITTDVKRRYEEHEKGICPSLKEKKNNEKI